MSSPSEITATIAHHSSPAHNSNLCIVSVSIRRKNSLRQGAKYTGTGEIRREQNRAEVFNENAVIFEKGGRGDFAYLLVPGEIGIYKNMRREAPIRLATLYKGDIFGEMALFNDSP